MPIQEWSDRIWVIQLPQEPELSEELTTVLEKMNRAPESPSLVLDCSTLKRINSSNLSQLIRIRDMTLEKKTHLRIAAIQDSVWVVFLTTGLDKVFEFSEDVPSALASLQMSDADE